MLDFDMDTGQTSRNDPNEKSLQLRILCSVDALIPDTPT